MKQTLNEQSPIDIADDFMSLSNEEIAVRMKLMAKDRLADTFAQLNAEKQMDVIKMLSDQEIEMLMLHLDEDEVVDTLQELPANMVNRLMTYYIGETRRPIINQLLKYPDESAGAIMSVNFLHYKLSTPVDQILIDIRESDMDTDQLEQVWVTNQQFELLGYVPLVTLIRHQGETIDGLYEGSYISASALEDQEEVAKKVHHYQLSEIPVVDSERRLVGIIEAEDVLSIMSAEFDEDFFNVSGIASGSQEGYFETSNFIMAKNRLSWLIICLITATMTSFIIQHYQATLASSVILSAYIPMLMDSGGNSGSQASTTLIRSISVGEVNYHQIFKVLLKEMQIGLYTGGSLAVINFIRIYFFDHADLAVNMTVSITLVIVVIISKMMGGILPLIADFFKIDPTVMAGPLITTVVDTVSLMVYFEVANYFIQL